VTLQTDGSQVGAASQPSGREPRIRKLFKSRSLMRVFDRGNFSPRLFASMHRLSKLRRQYDFDDLSLPDDVLREFDRINIELLYFLRLKRFPNLDAPRSFCEKLQWLKLHRRTPEMAAMSDKLGVRDYVSQRHLQKNLNELYVACRSVQQFRMAFASLPDQFVAKLSHWSGANMIVTDKAKFDWEAFEKMCQKLNQNYYLRQRKRHIGLHRLSLRNGEWNYANQDPHIVVERLLTNGEEELRDYKVFCFNGEPLYVQVNVDRSANHRICYYDTNWKKQPFWCTYPLYEGEVERPSKLDEMLKIARQLSKGFPFLRVDLYQPDANTVYIGELTFCHQSGNKEFFPQEWNQRLGDLIDLPLPR
jgi:hypothetical protein